MKLKIIFFLKLKVALKSLKAHILFFGYIFRAKFKNEILKSLKT